MLSPFIKTFLTAASCGSFSSAAKRLHLSRVSVMKQMNDLEALVGAPLFVRTHSGAVLTAAGRSFLADAEALVRLADDACLRARAAAQQKTLVRIGTSLMHPCQPLLRRWEEAGGDRFEFQLVPYPDDVDNMSVFLADLGRRIDCFVTPCGSRRLAERFHFLPLSTCRCLIAMGKDHPLAAKERLTWEDLEGQSLLLIKKSGSDVIDRLRGTIRREHPAVRILDYDGYFSFAAFNLCQQKGCLMEMPEIWAGLHPGLTARPMDWDAALPYGLLYADGPAEAFAAALAERLAR